MAEDRTFRTARASYELAVKLAAKVSPDDRGVFPDMSDKQRQQTLEAAHLWAQIADAHATLSLRDAVVRQCRTIMRALTASGVVTPVEGRIRGGEVEDEFELEEFGQ